MIHANKICKDYNLDFLTLGSQFYRMQNKNDSVLTLKLNWLDVTHIKKNNRKAKIVQGNTYKLLKKEKQQQQQYIYLLIKIKIRK